MASYFIQIGRYSWSPSASPAEVLQGSLQQVLLGAADSDLRPSRWMPEILDVKSQLKLQDEWENIFFFQKEIILQQS